jgi:ribosomal protein S13
MFRAIYSLQTWKERAHRARGMKLTPCGRNDRRRATLPVRPQPTRSSSRGRGPEAVPAVSSALRQINFT